MPRVLTLAIVFALALAGVSPLAAAPAPGPLSQADVITRLLTTMTPAEKVGQLFIVSFYGASAATGTDIHQLITQYHVGGVVLMAANDNITDTIQTPTQVLTLTNELQTAAIEASLTARAQSQPAGAAEEFPPFVPLFIAINHEGNGTPFTEIRSGLTDLPSAMSIGATWDATHAESMGRIVGTELSALGINLLLGPSLDVLEAPRPEGNDLGTRVFGGDPFWVGHMGEAYIRGVHFGSEDRVAVVAKHFPGHGGSDRRPEDELPTVRKSIEDLTSFDLLPFFAVAADPRGPGTADGMLAAHIRFQGFQGSFRQNTRPVSLDAQALQKLLGLPQLAAWRQSGGIIVSDSLGVTAVKQFYDPSLQSFNNRRVAQDAFNAGNDLLLLTEFGLNPRSDQMDRVVDTLTYFRQRYENDPNFATNVDSAVARILALKLRQSGGVFDPATVVRPLEGLSVLQRDQEDVTLLAQDAAALLSPTADELEALAPEPPGPGERLVFFTDVREARQCSFCPRAPAIATRQLEEAIVQLYGPQGSGQVRGSALQSFTFDDLAAYLEGGQPAAPEGEQTPTPPPPAIQTALEQANWIVFSMLNPTPDVPSSRVVSAFLAQRPDIVRSKKVVVFAFDAPYYLDTTELSKVTAFYGLYSHTAPFVMTAARLLFRDVPPTSAPPVSVPAVGYNLIEITRPDPHRPIELFWQKASPPPAGGTPEPTGLRLGDAITVTTGVLLDHNGHTVPDQTLVRFTVTNEEGLAADAEAPTVGGVASVLFELSQPGRLRITASSEPALASTVLEIPVQPDVPFDITPIIPTALPTETPQPTPTTTATPTITPTAAPTATQAPIANTPPARVNWRGFVILCLGLAVMMVGGYRLGAAPGAQPRQGLRLALAGAIAMLVGYNYYALGLPGSAAAFRGLGALAGLLFAALGGLAGLGVGWYWLIGRERE